MVVCFVPFGKIKKQKEGGGPTTPPSPLRGGEGNTLFQATLFRTFGSLARGIALKPSFTVVEVDQAYALGAAAFASTPEQPAEMPRFVAFPLYCIQNWNQLLDLLRVRPYRWAPKEESQVPSLVWKPSPQQRKTL